MVATKKMPTWEKNKVEYNKKYDKDTYKVFTLKLRKEDNDKVIDKLMSVPNKVDYIVKLIKEDLNKQ